MKRYFLFTGLLLLLAVFSGALPLWVWAEPACHNSNDLNGAGVDKQTADTKDEVVLSNGDFTISHRDLVIPDRGLSLELTRSYNAQPNFELTGWSHEADRGGSSWFLDGGALRGEGDRILTDRSFGNPVTVTVRMKTVQAQAGEADVAGENPAVVVAPSSWYVGWLNFGYQDFRNFYYFLIHRDGTLELSKLSNGALVRLTSASSSLSPFVWHTVSVEANGRRIRVWIDGKMWLEFTDTVIVPSGRVGLNAYWCHALFDDLSIQSATGGLSDNFNRLSRPESSLFGWGWSWNYNLKLEVQAVAPSGKSAKLIRADGGTVPFSSTDGVNFTSPAGVYGQLTMAPDGTGVYREKDGLRYEFDAAGRLARLVDRNGNAVSLSYDAASRPVKITGPTGLALTLAYGTNGKVAILTDPAGRLIKYRYDLAGNLLSVMDPLGKSVTYAYYPSHAMKRWKDKRGFAVTTNRYWYNGRVGSQTDPLGKVTRFQYLWDKTVVTNARGQQWAYTWKEGAWDRPVRVEDPMGESEWTAWDANGNRIGVTNRNGNQTEYEYDAKGNVTRMIRRRGEGEMLWDSRVWYEPVFNQVVKTQDAEERVTDFQYDSHGNLVQTTRWFWSVPLVTEMSYDSFGQLISQKDPLGNVTRYEYDAHGRRSAVVDALGNRTSFTYDLAGRLTSVTSAVGQITRSSYDAAGNLLSVVNALNQTMKYTYDADGRVLTMTDPNGKVTQTAYDALGNVAKVTDPVGAVTAFAYDTTNYLFLASAPRVSETDPLGKKTLFSVDAYDRVVAVTDPLGNVTKTAYDGVGNVISVTDPEGRVTTTAYDPLNRRVSVKDALGNETLFSYSRNGDLLSITDPTGAVTRYEYDSLHRRTAVVDALGNRTTYEYDALDRLIRVVDPFGNAVRHFYDELGRPAAQVDPDLGTWEYRYDAAGNLIRQTDAKGQQILWTYDPLNRPVKREGRSSATDPPVTLATYAYDSTTKPNGIGRLSKVADPSGSTEFWYDPLGREIKQVKTIGAESFTLSRVYDLKGQLTQLVYPDGEILRYGYDAAGRSISAAGASVYVSSAQYNKASQPTQITFGNQAVTQYAYDGAGRLSRLLTNGTRQDLSYTYDKRGSVVALTDRVGTATQSFTYDAINRLTQAASSFYGTKTYRYDAIGNLLEKEGATLTYGASGIRPHAVTSFSDPASSTFSLSYDANGSMTGKGQQTLGYDLENRLIQVNPAGVVWSYDASGVWVKQVTPGSTKRFLGDLYEVETTSGGTSVSKQIYLGSFRVAVRKTGVGAGVYFHHTDHLGSTSVVTNSAGAVVERVEYTPFGSISRHDLSSSGSTGGSSSRYFTGKPLEKVTGLYYFGARHYDPMMGRWITPDPTIPDPFNPQSLNRYSYVTNNPINLTDPTGYAGESWLDRFSDAVTTYATTGDSSAVSTSINEVISAAANGSDPNRTTAGVNSGVAASRSVSDSAIRALASGADPAHAANSRATAGNSGVQSHSGTQSDSLQNTGSDLGGGNQQEYPPMPPGMLVPGPGMVMIGPGGAPVIAPGMPIPKPGISHQPGVYNKPKPGKEEPKGPVPQEGVRHPDGSTTEIKWRPTPGRDGGRSRIRIERDPSGKVREVWHEVFDKDGNIIHQHPKPVEGSGSGG